MAYPTPSIYTYRVREVNPVNRATGDNAYFEAEFSTDSGSTWLPLLGRPFQSLTEAYQGIAKIVGSESRFQEQYENPNGFNVPAVVPALSTHAYPPA